MLDFYRAISTNSAERFDELVSADPSTLVIGTAPGEWVIERPRLRSGFGYDVLAGKRARYFAFISPETEHVHLGFEYGTWMADAHHLLLGAHLNLRKVRFVTYEPGDPIPVSRLVEYTRQAARLATMTAGERLSHELERVALPADAQID